MPLACAGYYCGYRSAFQEAYVIFKSDKTQTVINDITTLY